MRGTQKNYKVRRASTEMLVQRQSTYTLNQDQEDNMEFTFSAFDLTDKTRKKKTVKPHAFKQRSRPDQPSAQHYQQMTQSDKISNEVQPLPWYHTPTLLQPEQCPPEAPTAESEDVAADEQDPILAPATCGDPVHDPLVLESSEPQRPGCDDLAQDSSHSEADARPDGIAAGCEECPDDDTYQGCAGQQESHPRPSTECGDPCESASNFIMNECSIPDSPDESHGPTYAGGAGHENLVEIDDATPVNVASPPPAADTAETQTIVALTPPHDSYDVDRESNQGPGSRESLAASPEQSRASSPKRPACEPDGADLPPRKSPRGFRPRVSLPEDDCWSGDLTEPLKKLDQSSNFARGRLALEIFSGFMGHTCSERSASFNRLPRCVRAEILIHLLLGLGDLDELSADTVDIPKWFRDGIMQGRSVTEVLVAKTNQFAEKE